MLEIVRMPDQAQDSNWAGNEPLVCLERCRKARRRFQPNPVLPGCPLQSTTNRSQLTSPESAIAQADLPLRVPNRIYTQVARGSGTWCQRRQWVTHSHLT